MARWTFQDSDGDRWLLDDKDQPTADPALYIEMRDAAGRPYWYPTSRECCGARLLRELFRAIALAPKVEK